MADWGGSVRIRDLSSEERDELETRIVKFRGQRPELNTDGFKNFRAALVSQKAFAKR